MRRLTRMLVNRANAIETSATPEDDERDGEHLHARILRGEGEVAVADRGHRFHREVGRGQEPHMAVGVGIDVREAKDDRREGDERQQPGDGEGQPLVALFHQAGGLTGQAPGDGDGPQRRPSGPLQFDAAELELVFGAQHRHAVARDHLMVPARALRHFGAVGRHDGHRSQVPEMAPESRVGGHLVLAHLHLDHCEVHAGELYAVFGAAQACLDEGRAGQGGDIEHAPLARDALEGTADGRVRHLGDDPHVGPDLPDAQCGLERVYLLHLGVDHRHGMLQARIHERVTAEIRTASQMGDTPVLENAGEADIRLRVDDDDRRATQVQLLDNTESDALQAAHDDVIAQVVIRLRYQLIVARVFVISGCRSVEDAWDGCVMSRLPGLTSAPPAALPSTK